MSRYRVMVVDDDQDVRFVVSSLLGLEFETVEAQNGLDALEKIDRYEPDLLLVDINMPVMNGIACCHAIQRNPSFSHLPVIFISAASDRNVRDQAKSAGGKDYIEKPFDSALLIDRIKGFFDRQGRPPSPKSFTPEEIEKIDAMPLQVVEGDVEELEPEPGLADTHAGDIEEELEGGKRRRRVFGRRKKAPPKVEAPPSVPEPKPEPEPSPPAADESKIELPEPPKPDYQRASSAYQRRIQELEERLKRIEQEAEKSRSAPPPPPAPAVEAPKPEREEKKPAPVPAAPPPARPAAKKPVEPSAAEILAQRRLAGIGRKAGKAASKPRVLVIIDHPRQLETSHAALKGVAEYLPLEDPVEAIELIARFQPDIVIMGIREEKYSGLQIASMIRSNQRLSHIQVIFVQGVHAEASHLAAAQKLSRNPILRPPFNEVSVRHAVQGVMRLPGFKVREKNLGYGVYVKEVLQSVEQERRQENKLREKESIRDHHLSLARFMANELRDYKEAEGYEELKGIGAKVHHVHVREEDE